MHKHWVNVAAVASHPAGAYAMRSSCKQETKEDVGEPGYRVKRGGHSSEKSQSAQYDSLSLFSIMVSQRQFWKYAIKIQSVPVKSQNVGYLLFCALCFQHSSPPSQLLNN